ncbi:asparagine synthase-related protein [Flavobacterium sp.]|uniref:asparagine synthase-related protein n=1 Tax=Flavobacterium sp. TaxID=239 RepID=UPI003529715B
MSNSFDNFNSLGFFNPYYVKINGNLKIETEFSNILDYSERMLDINSVSQILKFGFTLGDRTLISDIYKTPWMAKPNKSNSGWSFFDVPNHKEQLLSKDYIYSELYCRLQNELSNYITGKSNVGILLTGGMDSRVVAAVLSKLQSEKCFANINVYAFTWGTLDSRDVIYAKKIAQLYNWKWQHLEIDVDQVRENIEYTINTGCEFSPIHLHAMPKILENKYLDCVLAGSFGDSIGRGEYSGVKVKNLKPFENKINKSTILFNSKIYNSVLTDCLKDIKYYHEKFPQTKNYQQLEQDYQLHYMRKMLNPCMNVINKEIPVYQMFSSPEVFGFMCS